MKKNWKVLISLMTGILVFGVLTTGCKDEEDDNGAEQPAFNHEGHSYLIVKTQKTWTEAAADAVAKGGYLAEIESQAEQTAIYQAIGKSGISTTYTEVPDGGGAAYIWIGATDRASKDAWIWNGGNKSGTFPVFWIGDNTGDAVAGSYHNWGGKSAGKLNEPDNYTSSQYAPNGQHTAAIGLAKWPTGSSSPLGVAGEWNDINESNKIYYIIEFDTVK